MEASKTDNKNIFDDDNLKNVEEKKSDGLLKSTPIKPPELTETDTYKIFFGRNNKA